MSPSYWIEPRAASELQRRLAARVVPHGTVEPELVCGVDMGVRGGLARAALCVFSYPDLTLVEARTSVRPLEFPYVPGLLAFREMPAILDACAKLEHEVDIFLVDGHGYAHPRRFGLACYLGVELDRPAIGCGKSRLVGEHREPASRRGSRTRVLHRDEVVGYYVRTRDGVKPLYVSIGHKIDLDSAVRLVLRCTPRYRLPEPIRAADRLAGAMDAKGRVPAGFLA